MRLDDSDRLVGAVTTAPGRGVIVTNDEGNEREVTLKEIPLASRASKGHRVIKRMTLTSVRSIALEGGAANGRA